MIQDLLREYVGESAAPFVAVALFVVVVGVSLWLTPHLARWIDNRKNRSHGFFDSMLEHMPETEDEK